MLPTNIRLGCTLEIFDADCKVLDTWYHPGPGDVRRASSLDHDITLTVLHTAERGYGTLKDIKMGISFEYNGGSYGTDHTASFTGKNPWTKNDKSPLVFTRVAFVCR
jgi:hypothetical protein